MIPIRLTIIVAAIAGALICMTQYRIITQLNSIERHIQESKSVPRSAARAAARPTPDLPTKAVSLDGATLRGNARAQLAILMYSDFQCPYCAKFADTTFRQLDDEYIGKGRVLFAFRHLPLTAIHPLALPAATAATCAGRQGKFWEMHDRLFANAKQLANTSWRSFAQELNLDAGRFDQCVTGEGPAGVSKDIELADALQVTGTPTFFIGTIDSPGTVTVTHRFSGGQPLSRFRSVLDPLLVKAAAN
jgi:protein-disulfide isomerase